MPGSNRSRRTAGKSSLLERTIEAIELRRFHVYRTYGEFERAVVLPARYVVRGYPHPSLWGTRGYKEAVIVSPPAGRFKVDEDGRIRIVVEAKWQEGSGSVDEKLAYVWLAFLDSPIRNWIALIDGRYWQIGRGAEAVAWLSRQSPPATRTFCVVDHRGFIELVGRTWQ